ncbi:RsmB/NOP family class I SAM-dependent RNA methyltransferase [Anaerohalosphaeraceae bacterium U12dextr]
MESNDEKIEKHLLSARGVAAEVLQKLDISRHDTSARLERWMARTDQRARATDLVHGVIRNLSAIDLVLSQTARIRMEHTDKKILALLRTGTYELIYVPRTPEYAIVNETVEIAGRLSRKAGGFVNAVLRNVQRAIELRSVALAGQPPRKILPAEAQAGCLFKTDLLPDPQQDLALFLGTAFSLPAWLVRRWLVEFGPEATKHICIASNRRPTVVLRPNTLQTTTAELAAVLASEGIETSPTPDGTGLTLLQAVDITGLSAFEKGLFFVQDQAAYEAIHLLPVQAGWRILDLCAAPGTKTAVLAGLLRNTGQLYASDADKVRLQKVRQNCQRLKLGDVDIIEPEHLKSFLASKPRIDAVIADVPCSNTGVLARRCEARWRLEEKAIRALTAVQKQLLHQALSIVRPGGYVLYSTCSILAEENQMLVRSVLAERQDGHLLKEHVMVPQTIRADRMDHDGGYAVSVLKT